MTEQKTKSKRGFASMDPERQREIARKGGASLKPENRSFSRNPKLAAEAGRKGGMNSSRKKQNNEAATDGTTGI